MYYLVAQSKKITFYIIIFFKQLTYPFYSPKEAERFKHNLNSNNQSDTFSDMNSDTMSMASFSQHGSVYLENKMNNYLRKRGIHEIGEDRVMPYTRVKMLKVQTSSKSGVKSEISFLESKIQNLKKCLQEKLHQDDYFNKKGKQLLMKRRQIDDDLIESSQNLINTLVSHSKISQN